MKKILPLVLFCSFLTGCTYSVNLVHTSGKAKDVIDETQTPTTHASPAINVPVQSTSSGQSVAPLKE